VAYKRSWCEIFPPTFTKKEKRTKKERKPVETAAAVEIDKGGLRRLLLDDFHSRLKKPPHKTLRLFHSSNRPDYYAHILRLRRRKTKTGNDTYTKFRTHPTEVAPIQAGIISVA